MTVRYRREQNAIDTAEKPDIKMYVDQYPVPIKVSTQWTLGADTTVVGGVLTFTATADDEVSLRNIPGVLEGHAYRMTVVLDSIDAGVIALTISNVSVGTMAAAGTHVFDFRGSVGNSLWITIVNNASVITGAISSIHIESLDSINGDLLPSL